MHGEEIKSQVSNFVITNAKKVLREELFNKEAQTKQEKMLGEAKLN
jgi:hypothetical protein